MKKVFERLNEIRKRFILTEKEAAEIDRKMGDIDAEFQQKTADYKGEDIWEFDEFIRLLSLADNAYLGKTKSILYAYKLGYLAGQEKQDKERAKQMPEQKMKSAYRANIVRKTYDIESVDILRYISIITDDIYKEWEQMKGEKA